MQIAKSLLLAGLALSMTTGFAVDISNTVATATTVNTSAMTPDQLGQYAATWSLTPSEYQNYLNLMQNSPAGIWYKNLDPVEVLGLMAKTTEDRTHYAEVEAKIQFQRVSNEIAYANAFKLAIKQDHPNLKPIDPRYANAVDADYTKGSEDTLSNQDPLAAQRGDTFLLFTSPDNQEGNILLAKLIKKQNSISGLKINIYLTGTNNNAAAQQWATMNHIPVAAVNHGNITLNFDNGKLDQVMSGYQGNYSLPVVVRERNGEQTVMPSGAV